MAEAREALAELVEAACVPLDGGHATGTLERAQAVLADHPALARESLYAAAILGDDASVERLLAEDAASASRKGGPRGWDPLTYLCFSRYLRLDRARSEAFVRTAAALLDAGASPNTGFTWDDELEAAIYGAAGVARHAGLTRLLLERGADPNDGETAYHAPESYDHSVLKLLVECGRLSDESLTVMLVRKHDWHDQDGVRFLLEHGADPNRASRWGQTALHQALRRDNALPIIELLLDLGVPVDLRFEEGDAYVDVAKGSTALHVAAWRARPATLKLLIERGASVDATDGQGRTPLALAVRACVASHWTKRRSPESVAALLAAGAAVSAAPYPSGYPEVGALLRSRGRSQPA
jgi:ankyrin repeat protein